MELKEEAKNKKYPRVLIISHNVFSTNTSMGKTMESYFKGWDPECIAQLYFHSEIPNSDVCHRYYKFTDIDAIKSIILRHRGGTRLTEKDIELKRPDACDTGKMTEVYNWGRKRSPLIYMARDLVWSMSAWNTSGLKEWLFEFSPEVIFYASGDYEFSYKIAAKIQDMLHVPMITCCFDDYYLFDKNENVFLGKTHHKHFMKTVRKTINKSKCVITVNDMMSDAYTRLFNKKCPILYTGSDFVFDDAVCKKNNSISYLGGLALNRYLQLIDIGKAIKSLNLEDGPSCIDVYSAESDPVLLEKMNMENGINFHGSVPASEVKKIIKQSLAVIHTESFDKDTRRRVKYSLSTKISDCLSSGTCLFAYGPEEVASIQYLIKYNTAVVATDKDTLSDKLRELIIDDKLRMTTTDNALKIAKKNHEHISVQENMYGIICDAV